MYSYQAPESGVTSGARTPVTCVACGCRLEPATGARDGEYHHFRPFDGRDARGCRVACVGLVHDATGRPLLADVA
jgi:hypothetical protein